MTSLPLTDADYLRFLDEGYLVIQPSSLGPDDHRTLYDRAGELYDLADGGGGPSAHLTVLGDNLRAQVPAIDRVLEDPRVTGALERILGPRPLLHPHSYCHRSSPTDQVFHQDGNLPWNERGHYRSHVGDWAMLFYYPQAVDGTNGPTEVVVGSQYWTIDHETADGWHRGDRIDRTVTAEELSHSDPSVRDERLTAALANGLGLPGLERRFVTVPAGSVVLAHYDLIHRGSRTGSATSPRYLYKFYFARVRRGGPGSPRPTSAPRPTNSEPGRADVIEAAWRWAHGGEALYAGPAANGDHGTAAHPGLAELEREDQRLAAAYGLARAGDRSALAAALRGPTEAGRRAASHGLRAMGRAGVEPLVEGLAAASAPVRRASAAGLASHHAAQPPVVDALVTALATDPDDLVRSLSAYALGLLARADEADGVAIAEALVARLVPGAEADNAHGAGFSRSTVRQSAALALVLTMANHRVGSVLATVADLAGSESDRYVEALLVEALVRADEDLPGDAARRLLARLAAHRWAPAPVVAE
ncbi:MAG: phytanoyl-CoA dioxygenase family protein [Actinomycetota bacterium]